MGYGMQTDGDQKGKTMRIEGIYYCPACGCRHEIDDRFDIDGPSYWVQKCDNCGDCFNASCSFVKLFISTMSTNEYVGIRRSAQP